MRAQRSLFVLAFLQKCIMIGEMRWIELRAEAGPCPAFAFLVPISG